MLAGMTVTLPDGTELNVPEGATGLEVATAIGERLGKAAVAVEIDGEIRDLRLPVPAGATVRILTARDPEALAVLRHSAAHVMAEAVVKLYPGTKVTIGPAIENGFYYDFEFPEGVTIREEDLAAIEAQMQKLVDEGREWQRWEVTRDEALEYFRERDEGYKVELIEALPENEPITFYKQGEFTDLCRGPHIQSTKGAMKAIKLTSVAGAYWRGDSDNTMLTRLYGTAFFSKEDLATHLHQLEEARKRDHRKLGTRLDLFSLHEESPGSPFWHPRGLVIWNAITDMWREQHLARGYEEVKTPILFTPDLWKTSGHWDVYKENMFLTQDGERQFGMKPMNCPAHCLIVKRQQWSYRDMPIRINEQGLVHRNEPSGTLHGLMRVRHITQDDAHIFCTPEQILDEVTTVLQFVLDLYKLFGFDDYAMELSTRPAKSVGSDEMWQKAEAALAEALVRNDIEYTLNPGDGAFYGPKIDFHIRDSIGRTWQCGTIQLDFSTPERFEMTFTGSDNQPHPMVMIHRALLGSMERFMGILIEHYGGEFPMWLAPNQVTVIPVAERHNDYVLDVVQQFREAGLRVDADLRSEGIGVKIRDTGPMRTPVVLVVGDQEVDAGTVTVTRRGVEGKVTRPVAELVAELADEVRDRAIGPAALA
jgi:threonyl-tRNA synthetase